METKTPNRKIIKPDSNIFLSADKRKKLPDIEVSLNSPITPLKSLKSKLILSLDTSKCSLSPSHKTQQFVSENSVLSFIKIIPTIIFKDIPNSPSNLPDLEEWIRRNLKNLNFIGSGHFSDVFLVSFEDNKSFYALKRIKDVSSTSNIKNSRREIINLWKLKGSKNCLQIYMGWEDKDYVNILTDYYPRT